MQTLGPILSCPGLRKLFDPQTPCSETPNGYFPKLGFLLGHYIGDLNGDPSIENYPNDDIGDARDSPALENPSTGRGWNDQAYLVTVCRLHLNSLHRKSYALNAKLYRL